MHLSKLVTSLCAFILTFSAFATAAEVKVLAVSGSTREGSFNKKLAQQAAQIAKDLGATVTYIDLKDYQIPLYDEDLEKKGMPEAAKAFRNKLLQSDVVIIASPEYNNSVSAVLKNAIDWSSRDEQGKPSRDAFKGKTFALISTSPGPTGGARHLPHLQAIIEDIGGTVVPTKVGVPNAYTAFTPEGTLKDPQQKAALEQEIKEALKKA
jgi:chromate reductase